MIVVKDYMIIGTKVHIYEAWEPSSLMGEHSTISYINGKCYGLIGSKTYKEDEFKQAYDSILKEHPYFKNKENVRYSNGRIEVIEDDFEQTYYVGDEIEIVNKLQLEHAIIKDISSDGKILLDRKVFGSKTLSPIDSWTTKGFQKGFLGDLLVSFKKIR